ncbi:MAG: DUF2283 domain-containing protein [Candidatus Bipolaricaulia bacterium]
MGKKLNIWFDQEGDFLEFSTADRKGFFKDAGDDLFKRVDEQGNIIGFAILNVSKKMLKDKRIELPVEFELKASM